MNPKRKAPVMIVFAGNNGSGKSNLRSVLLDNLMTAINIDPDIFVKKHRGIHRNPDLAGGREAIKMVDACIENKVDFSIETTFSGKSIIQKIKKAKEKGFTIQMYYLGTDMVEINIARIEQRVLNGGHHIPEETVRDRSSKTIRNLINNLDLPDALRVIDTTGIRPRTILIQKNGKTDFLSKTRPDWVHPVVANMQHGNIR